jgi:hypothetical protein
MSPELTNRAMRPFAAKQRFLMGAGMLCLALALAWQAVLPDHSNLGHFLRGMLIGISLVLVLSAVTISARQRRETRG